MTIDKNENRLNLVTHPRATEFKSPEVASSPEIRYINVLEPFVTGSVLLYYAVLAYPNRNEWPKRRKFVEAMAAMRFREFAVQGAQRKNIPAYYRRFKREKMLCGVNLGWKRIERRIHAGTMGWCIVLNEKYHRYAAPTPDGKVGFFLHGPNTVNKVIRAFVESRQATLGQLHFASESALANVAHRIWAESFPILHLAMSNPITVKIVELQANAKPFTLDEITEDLFDSIHDPAWLRKAIEDAEKLRLNLRERLGTDPDDPRGLGYNSEKAISLLPTEDLSQTYRP